MDRADQARESLWVGKKELKRESVRGRAFEGTARVFIELEKRRLVRARALPNSGAAKPGGCDTTIPIITLNKNLN
jgi:hypothetical protein